MKSPIKSFDEVDLLSLIEDKKSLLAIKVFEHGFTHKETLEVSQQLDTLLNKYQLRSNYEEQARYSI